MATITKRSPAHAARLSPALARMPLWGAVVCSRLLVLAAGAAAALSSHRVHGWSIFDPHRLSSGQGALGNVLASSVLRWDGIRYVTIAEHGYTTAAQTVSFPLYSLLIRVVSWVVVSPVLAGVLISLVSFSLGLVLLHRITSEELGRRVADATVLLLAFAPLSFFFSAVYTESLLFVLALATFQLARREHFGWACVAASAAALTHLQGVVLVAPIAVMYWRAHGRPLDPRRLLSLRVLPIALPPMATASFFIYLAAQGYGWLAPITNDNMANYGRYVTGPFVLLLKAVEAGAQGVYQTLDGVRPISPVVSLAFNPGFQNLIYLVVLVVTVLALVGAWRRLPVEYALYATLIVAICLQSAVVHVPLEALDRYMLPVFPLWMAAAAWLDKRRLVPSVVPISAVMLIFYTVMFARWVFIA